jgi:hypothetical protein
MSHEQSGLVNSTDHNSDYASNFEPKVKWINKISSEEIKPN